MLVAEQRLHHRQIHPGLGQRGAERVPQRVRMPRRHTGFRPVVPENRAQPGRGQRLAPVRRPWPPRTTADWSCPAARPAGRSGSTRQRRHPAAPAAAWHPYPSPAANARRYRRQRRRGPAPPRRAARTTASTRPSRDPARTAGYPTARRSRADPKPLAVAVVRVTATRSDASVAPDAPAIRSAHPRSPTAPLGPSAPDSTPPDRASAET